MFKFPILYAAADEEGGGGAAKPKKVKVKVLCAALGEGADNYKRGDEFTTTKERAEQLGELVQIV